MAQHPTRTTSRRPLIRGRSVPAYVVAIGALVLSLAGGATAAGLIDGGRIQPNTVTGKQVKDGSLKLKDLKKSQVAKLRGKNGTNGAAGASAFAPPPPGTVIKGGGILSAQVSGTVLLRNFAPLPFTVGKQLTGPTEITGVPNLAYGVSPWTAAEYENATLCAGTATAPSAAPGTLCVYVSDVENVLANTAQLFGGNFFQGDAADSNGFFVNATSAAAGSLTLRYVWVYTAA